MASFKYLFCYVVLLIFCSVKISGHPIDISHQPIDLEHLENLPVLETGDLPTNGGLDDLEEDSLGAGYYQEQDQETQDLQQIFVQDQDEPLNILLKDFKEWSKKTYVKQIGSEPNDEELEDYMYDMIVFLL